MSRESALIANLVSTLETTAMPSAVQGSTALRDMKDLYDPESLAREQSKDRRFVLRFEGPGEETGFQGTQAEFTELVLVFDLTVAYSARSRRQDLLTVLVEDARAIQFTLARTDNYDQVNTGIIWRRAVPGPIEWPDSASGVVLATYSVRLRYQPQFA